MGEPDLPRDVYDLYYQRSSDKFWRDLGWTEQQVADSRTRRIELDHLSNELRPILEKRDALILCLHFLTCTIQKYIPFSFETISYFPCTRMLTPSRQDGDNEVEELRTRLDAARRDRLLEVLLVRSLAHVSELARDSHISLSAYTGPQLLYRVHQTHSHTFYDKDVGFCCPRWLRYRDFDKPTGQDFYHHANGHQESQEAQGTFETPYISMTSSPRRALNLVQDDEMHSADIFIIDAQKLRDMSIRFEPTTAIADRDGIPYTGAGSSRRAHYITKTHWVARYWIPADCIVKRIPFLHFQRVCNSNLIFRGTDHAAHSPCP